MHVAALWRRWDTWMLRRSQRAWALRLHVVLPVAGLLWIGALIAVAVQEVRANNVPDVQSAFRAFFLVGCAAALCWCVDCLRVLWAARAAECLASEMTVLSHLFVMVLLVGPSFAYAYGMDAKIRARVPREVVVSSERALFPQGAIDYDPAVSRRRYLDNQSDLAADWREMLERLAVHPDHDRQGSRTHRLFRAALHYALVSPPISVDDLRKVISVFGAGPVSSLEQCLVSVGAPGMNAAQLHWVRAAEAHGLKLHKMEIGRYDEHRRPLLQTLVMGVLVWIATLLYLFIALRTDALPWLAAVIGAGLGMVFVLEPILNEAGHLATGIVLATAFVSCLVIVGLRRRVVRRRWFDVVAMVCICISGPFIAPFVLGQFDEFVGDPQGLASAVEYRQLTWIGYGVFVLLIVPFVDAFTRSMRSAPR